MRRSVLVTGAGSGIGLVVVRELAGRGFHVVAGVHAAAQLARVREAVAADGQQVEAVELDVTDEEARRAVLRDRELYALVNNAGYFNAGAVEDVPLRAAREQLEAMVLAPVELARLALPAMRRAGDGRIVNISSALGRASLALSGWYQASKQALEAVSDALRLEVAADGIDVIVIRPGAVETPIWERAAADLRRRRVGSVHSGAYDRALALISALDGRRHPPRAVARLVGDVLTSGGPRPAYVLGRDAAGLAGAAALLPIAAKDRLVRALMGT